MLASNNSFGGDTTPTTGQNQGGFLSLQNYGDATIRIYGTAESPLFVAADVCRVLGLDQVTRALDGVDDDEKGVTIGKTPGGEQKLSVVTESGLYALIFKSRKQEAKAFRKWVTGEVLPTLRKTGSFGLNQSKPVAPSLPANYLEALKALTVEVEAREQLTRENAKLAPKAATFDLACQSDHLLDMNAALKLVAGGHRTTFMCKLREKKVLLLNNTPAQEYLDRGYFKLKESIWENPETGKVHVSLKTMVTQKGLDFLRRCVVRFAQLEAEAKLADQAKFPTIAEPPAPHRSLVEAVKAEINGKEVAQ